MKSLLRIILSVFASLALIAGTVVPAQAASMKFDVTKLTAQNIVVKSSKWSSQGYCYRTSVSMSHKKSGVGEWGVTTDIGKAGQEFSYVGFDSKGNTKRTKTEICIDDNSGYGTYTLGPSNILVTTSKRNRNDTQTTEDFTKGSFKVRGHVKTGLTAKRKGSKVTLTATAKRYSLTSEKYTAYSPAKAKFQVKSGSKWKTLKTVKLTKGKRTYTVKSSKAKSYRFVTSATSTSTASTSKTVRR